MEILSPGGPQRLALDRLRAERAKCEAQLDSVSAAFLTLDDAMSRFMTRQAESRDRAASYFTAYARPGSAPGPLADGDWIGAKFWLDPEGFEKLVRAALKRELPAGTSMSARTAAIAKLQARLDELEVAEESEICRLEAAGFVVDRRADVDLEMLLEVWNRDVAA